LAPSRSRVAGRGQRRVGMGDDAATVEQLRAELRELHQYRDLYEAARAEIEHRDRALAEALEQQTAIGDVLAVIASSPNDLQTVLDTIAATASRLCGSDAAAVQRLVGDRLFSLAMHARTREAEVG